MRPTYAERMFDSILSSGAQALAFLLPVTAAGEYVSLQDEDGQGGSMLLAVRNEVLFAYRQASDCDAVADMVVRFGMFAATDLVDTVRRLVGDLDDEDIASIITDWQIPGQVADVARALDAGEIEGPDDWSPARLTVASGCLMLATMLVQQMGQALMEDWQAEQD